MKTDYKVGDEVLLKGYIVEIDDNDKFLPYKISLHNCELINNMWCASSSVIEKDDWTPCSEMMPKEGVNVLFQIKGIIDPLQFTPRVGHFDNGHWWMYPEPQYSRTRIDDEYEVVAWRPLPEGYVEPEPEDIFKAHGFSDDICEMAIQTCADTGIKPETIIDLLVFIQKKTSFQ